MLLCDCCSAVAALDRACSGQLIALSSFPVFTGRCIISRICPKPEHNIWETHIANQHAAEQESCGSAMKAWGAAVWLQVGRARASRSVQQVKQQTPSQRAFKRLQCKQQRCHCVNNPENAPGAVCWVLLARISEQLDWMFGWVSLSARLLMLKASVKRRLERGWSCRVCGCRVQGLNVSFQPLGFAVWS